MPNASEVISEYSARANKFLADHGITFQAVYVGEDCPMFCEDQRKVPLVPGTFPRKTHIHGSHWRLTLSAPNRKPLTVEFWDSYNDAEIRAIGTVEYRRGTSHRKYGLAGKPQPEAYDLLTCLEKYEPEPFEAWAESLGMDSDSRKAETIHRACVAQWQDVQRFFTAEELKAAREIN